MILIWQGYGFLAVLIPIVLSALSALLVDGIEGKGYYASHPIASTVTLLASAAIVWFLGVRLNERQQPRVLQDVQTGQVVQLKKRHTIFWIPMQWFSAAIVAFAAYQIFK